MFPEASVQNLTGSWWQASQKKNLERGRLVWAIVPYPDMKPLRLVPQGRGDDARQHDRANICIEEFRTGDPPIDPSTLPVAGIPVRQGESHLVRRGKLRPAVVLALEGVPVEAEFKRTSAKWQHNPALLLAPYYGTASDGTRGGWNPEFVSRIQRVEYSQYVWDILPVGGSDVGSVLRLDHIFPIGADPANWKITEFKLREEALKILDEWVTWHGTGPLQADGLVDYCRRTFAGLPPP
jgi:hypothetical protein